jgi:hypothetical protein
MDDARFQARSGGSGGNLDGRGGADHPPDEWAELLARTVAHLAAQLTMTQIRLRALATELAATGVEADRVQRRVQTIAAAETGRYLRENLGEALAELIDVEALETDIAAFLGAEPATGA